MGNKLIIAAILGVTSFSLAVPAEARINERQKAQKHRIIHGVKNGSLTWREAHRLGHQQAHIARYERRARKGGLTWRERARIERKQDKASRSIWRQKHDRQRRW